MPVIKRVPDFDEGKTFIIENVFVDYSSVFRPNTKYRPEWAVVIRVPQHLQQEFYEVGFRLKQDPNGVVTLRSKRYVRLDDGTEMAPPTVVDCENQPWPEARGLIGNGSRANVKVRAKYTTYQGVEGLSCFLEGLQVLDHVPYVGGTDFGAAAGSTGGWSGQNFQSQPQPAAPADPFQQPAPAQQFAPPVQQPVPVQPAFNPAAVPQQAAAPVSPFAPPAAAAPTEYHPTQVAPVQAPPAFAPPAQPVQQAEFVPPGIPQGVPVGAPVDGNVSQPAGALGSFGQPAPAPAETPAQTDFVPANHSMGEDVPFDFISKVIAV